MDVSGLFPRMGAFIEAAEAITRLTQEQRRAFADWLREGLAKQQRPDAAAVRKLAGRLGAPEQVVSRSASVVGHVLLVQRRRGLSWDAVTKALREAGVSEEAAAQVAEVMEGMAAVVGEGVPVRMHLREGLTLEVAPTRERGDVVEAEGARLLAMLPAEYQEQARAFVGGLQGAGDFELEEVMRDEDLYG